MLFTFLFPPFFPILWVFFLLVFIQIHIPGSRPESLCRTCVCFYFSWDLCGIMTCLFLLLCFPAHSQLLTLRNSNPKPLRLEQTKGMVQAKPVDVWVGVEREGVGPERRQCSRQNVHIHTRPRDRVLYSCFRCMNTSMELQQEGLWPEC